MTELIRVSKWSALVALGFVGAVGGFAVTLSMQGSVEPLVIDRAEEKVWWNAAVGGTPVEFRVRRSDVAARPSEDSQKIAESGVVQSLGLLTTSEVERLESQFDRAMVSARRELVQFQARMDPSSYMDLTTEATMLMMLEARRAEIECLRAGRYVVIGAGDPSPPDLDPEVALVFRGNYVEREGELAEVSIAVFFEDDELLSASRDYRTEVNRQRIVRICDDFNMRPYEERVADVAQHRDAMTQLATPQDREMSDAQREAARNALTARLLPGGTKWDKASARLVPR